MHDTVNKGFFQVIFQVNPYLTHFSISNTTLSNDTINIWD